MKDGFNPRPPLLAGESRGANGRDVAVGRVSIHARHCWRANPPAAAPAFFFHGVSIHARHCWRANPSDALYQSAPLPGFNPRPPLLAGESWLCWHFLKRHGAFQSTPAIAGGRIPLALAPDGVTDWFQSTPAIAGGRIRVDLQNAPFPTLFQSTPAIAGGRIRVAVLKGVADYVFQSTPAIAGGRIRPMQRRRWRASGFQSTPAIAGGRIRGTSISMSRYWFVSIHARHCWRANPAAAPLCI